MGRFVYKTKRLFENGGGGCAVSDQVRIWVGLWHGCIGVELMCLGCSWDRGVVVEKLPAAHMKIYLSIGGAETKWQQVAANRYFDSTIDAVKSR